MQIIYFAIVAPPAGIVPCDSLPTFSTPKCTKTCTDSKYSTRYNTDKHLARTSYSVRGEADMQKELMEKGTITVAFTVFEDFELYSTGVYKHVKGTCIISHASMLTDKQTRNIIETLQLEGMIYVFSSDLHSLT